MLNIYYKVHNNFYYIQSVNTKSGSGSSKSEKSSRKGPKPKKCTQPKQTTCHYSCGNNCKCANSGYNFFASFSNNYTINHNCGTNKCQLSANRQYYKEAKFIQYDGDLILKSDYDKYLKNRRNLDGEFQETTEISENYFDYQEYTEEEEYVYTPFDIQKDMEEQDMEEEINYFGRSSRNLKSSSKSKSGKKYKHKDEDGCPAKKKKGGSSKSNKSNKSGSGGSSRRYRRNLGKSSSSGSKSKKSFKPNTCPPSEQKENLIEYKVVTITNTCLCKTGYYDSGSTQCQQCHPNCLSCRGGKSTDCSICRASDNRIRNELTGQCECMDGFKEIGKQKCYLCHANCLSCSGIGINQCLSCDDGLNRIFDNQTNECIPKIGYFEDGQIKAQKCHNTCYKCFSDNDNSCLECESTSRVLKGTKCAPKQGYFENGQNVAEKCHFSCFTCTASEVSNCINCPPGSNRTYDNGKCVPKDGYTESGSKNAKKCHHSCLKCNGSGENQCTECQPNSNRVSNPLSGYCKPLEGFYNEGTNIVAQKCDPRCKNCTGPNWNQCLECTGGLNRIFNEPSVQGPSNCPCKDWSTMKVQDEISFLCICIDNAFKDSNGDCVLCNKKCGSCRGPTENDCYTCAEDIMNFTFINTDSNSQKQYGTCSYKENYIEDIKNPGKYICDIANRFYEKDNNCYKCYSSCQTCKGPQNNQCLSCHDSREALQEGVCKCDESKNFYDDHITNQCICRPGYYLDEIQDECFKCSIDNCGKCKKQENNIQMCIRFNKCDGSQQCPTKYNNDGSFTGGNEINEYGFVSFYNLSSSDKAGCEAYSDSRGSCFQWCQIGVDDLSTLTQIEKPTPCYRYNDGNQICDSDEICPIDYEQFVYKQNKGDLDDFDMIENQPIYTQQTLGATPLNNISCSQPKEENVCYQWCDINDTEYSNSKWGQFFIAQEPEICLEVAKGFSNDFKSCLSGFDSIYDVGGTIVIDCSCPSGELEKNNICIDCDSNCLQCDARPERCIQCDTSKYELDLFTDKCVCKDILKIINLQGDCVCPKGYYTDNSNNCVQCTDSDCLDCSFLANKETCLTCDSTKFKKPDINNSQNCTCFKYFTGNDCECNFLTNNREQIGDKCLCSKGYYQDPSDINNVVCLSCQIDKCLDCQFNNIEICIECNISDNRELNTNNTQCVCKNGYNLNIQTNTCQCNDGTFMKSDGSCQKCNPYCSKCRGPLITDCLDCDSNIFRSLQIISNNENKCECQVGHFDNLNDIACEKCFYTCKTCKNNKFDCDICSDNFKKSQEGVCLCDIRMYDDGTGCQDCHPTCKTCSDGLFDSCITCDLENQHRVLTTNGECQCRLGYEEIQVGLSKVFNCQECTYQSYCDIFVQKNKCDCMECKSNLNRSGIYCEKCSDGFYLDINLSVDVCQACNYMCGTCTQFNQCQICKIGDFRDTANPYDNCPCLPGYYDRGNLHCVMKVCETLQYSLSFSKDLNTIKLAFLNNINFIDTKLLNKIDKTNNQFLSKTCSLLFSGDQLNQFGQSPKCRIFFDAVQESYFEIEMSQGAKYVPYDDIVLKQGALKVSYCDDTEPITSFEITQFEQPGDKFNVKSPKANIKTRGMYTICEDIDIKLEQIRFNYNHQLSSIEWNIYVQQADNSYLISDDLNQYLKPFIGLDYIKLKSKDMDKNVKIKVEVTFKNYLGRSGIAETHFQVNNQATIQADLNNDGEFAISNSKIYPLTIDMKYLDCLPDSDEDYYISYKLDKIKDINEQLEVDGEVGNDGENVKKEEIIIIDGEDGEQEIKILEELAIGQTTKKEEKIIQQLKPYTHQPGQKYEMKLSFDFTSSQIRQRRMLNTDQFVESSTTQYLTIVYRVLVENYVVSLNGGDKQVSVQNPMQIQGQYKDINLPKKKQSQGFSFVWYCRDAITNDPCIDENTQQQLILDHSTDLQMIGPNTFKAYETKIFTFEAHKNGRYQLSSSEYQFLDVDIPSLVVKIGDKLQTERINMNDDIYVEVQGDQNPDDVQFQFNLLYIDNLVAMKKVGHSKFRFKIWDIFGKLESSSKDMTIQVFMFEPKVPLPGQVTFNIEINPPPLKGSIDIVPSKGQSLTTIFEIYADLYSDLDQPITYQYCIYVNEKDFDKEIEEGGKSTNNYKTIVSGDYITDPFFKTILPRANDTQYMTVMISAKDAKGAITNSTEIIQVEPFPVENLVQQLEQMFNELGQLLFLQEKINQVTIIANEIYLYPGKTEFLELKQSIVAYSLQNLMLKINNNEQKQQIYDIIIKMYDDGQLIEQMSNNDLKNYISQFRDQISEQEKQIDQILSKFEFYSVHQGSVLMRQIQLDMNYLLNNQGNMLEKRYKYAQRQVEDKKKQNKNRFLAENSDDSYIKQQYQLLNLILDNIKEISRIYNKVGIPNEEKIFYKNEFIEVIMQQSTRRELKRLFSQDEGNFLDNKDSFIEKDVKIFNIEYHNTIDNLMRYEDGFPYQQQNQEIENIIIRDSQTQKPIDISSNFLYYTFSSIIDPQKSYNVDQINQFSCIQKNNDDQWDSSKCDTVVLMETHQIKCICNQMAPTTVVIDTRGQFTNPYFIPEPVINVVQDDSQEVLKDQLLWVFIILISLQLVAMFIGFLKDRKQKYYMEMFEAMQQQNLKKLSLDQSENNFDSQSPEKQQQFVPQSITNTVMATDVNLVNNKPASPTGEQVTFSQNKGKQEEKIQQEQDQGQMSKQSEEFGDSEDEDQKQQQQQQQVSGLQSKKSEQFGDSNEDEDDFNQQQLQQEEGQLSKPSCKFSDDDEEQSSDEDKEQLESQQNQQQKNQSTGNNKIQERRCKRKQQQELKKKEQESQQTNIIQDLEDIQDNIKQQQQVLQQQDQENEKNLNKYQFQQQQQSLEASTIHQSVMNTTSNNMLFSQEQYDKKGQIIQGNQGNSTGFNQGSLGSNSDEVLLDQKISIWKSYLLFHEFFSIYIIYSSQYSRSRRYAIYFLKLLLALSFTSFIDQEMNDTGRIILSIGILVALSFFTRIFDEGFLANKFLIDLPLVLVYLLLFVLTSYIGLFEPSLLGDRHGSRKWLQTYLFAVIFEQQVLQIVFAILKNKFIFNSNKDSKILRKLFGSLSFDFYHNNFDKADQYLSIECIDKVQPILQ